MTASALALSFSALGALAVLAGACAFRRVQRAERELQGSRLALSMRLQELATLHSISREIVSSVDLARVFATLERECRRIFDVDFFFVATVDGGNRQVRVVYRRQGTTPVRETVRPLGGGLTSWVITHARSLRVDDFEGDGAELPFRPEVVDRQIRSALAVPLMMENRVTGVLSVQSRRAFAYDDHKLQLLYTIGQQAAVAIENARHFEMATVDSLTGLFLREHFFRRLAEEHTRASRYRGSFVLLMTDLDGFKQINDRYGHPVGDRYLQQLGTTIRGRLRAADLGCRYGGDEFCLLLPETSLSGAAAIAERLRKAVAGISVEHEGESITTTISIGLAAFPSHETGALESLLRKADQALYDAKRAGRDRVSSSAA